MVSYMLQYKGLPQEMDWRCL